MPGKQLYIPNLAMDLRERFRAPRPRSAGGLSPAAQAVLFHRLLRLDEAATTPSRLAAQLRYSAMSIGRSIDELVSAGLARAERCGREKRVRFEVESRKLFNASRDPLRNPVRAEKFIQSAHAPTKMKLAGESALVKLTDLSPPPLKAVAVAARDWKAVARNCGLVETGRDQAAHIVETWAYDPAALSAARTVDPLSLYARFRNHRDERVSIAAEKLLDGIPW